MRSRRKVSAGCYAPGLHNVPARPARSGCEVTLTPPLARATIEFPDGRYPAPPVKIIRGYATERAHP